MRKVFLSLLLLSSTVQAAPAKSPIPRLTLADLPAGCRLESGLHPLGEHIRTLYEYRQYQMVLPDLVMKDAQSVRCGAQVGTIYYFAYRSSDDRDQALLFSKPVVGREASSNAFKTWDKGFALVSYRQPPAALVHALESRLNGGHASSASSSAVLSYASSSSAASSSSSSSSTSLSSSSASSAASSATSESVSSEIAPSSWMSSSSASPIPMPQVPEPPSAVSSTPAPIVIEQMPEPTGKPTIVPVEKPQAPAPVLPKPVSKPVAKPSGKPPVKPTSVAPTSAEPELSIEVVSNIAAKLECEKSPAQAQAKFICSALQEFASALKPELPIRSGALYLGEAYTLDSYGRFTGLRYNMLVGAGDLPEASFFAYQSAGGTEDFQLGQLVDANKAKKPLPAGEMLARLRQTALKKRVPARLATGDRSLVVLPGGNRKVYIRKSGEHLVFVAPAGATVQDQLRNTLVIGILY